MALNSEVLRVGLVRTTASRIIMGIVNIDTALLHAAKLRTKTVKPAISLYLISQVFRRLGL